jgi:fructokinase
MATGPALVIGEALVDIVRHPSGRTFEAPGGSPLNVAVTLARLGVDTSLLTALANDPRTEAIVDHLSHSGVTLVDGARRLPRTSTATALVQTDGSAEYEFDLTWDPTPQAGPPARVVHAGSLALFLEPGEALVRRRLEERSGSALISLDPNIRPSMLPDLRVVRRTFEKLLPHANVVKLSDEDLAWLYPDMAGRDAVRRLLDAGPALVALTQGARGCTLASDDAEVDLPAVPTEVGDTIGAGDSFMGGLLWQILASDLVDGLMHGQSLSPDDLTALGAAAAGVAAVTVSRKGANPPWLSELVGS